MRERITASKLQTGETYLNDGLSRYRRILEIETDGYVTYESDLSYVWGCSSAHFARKCPYVATKEDVTRIDLNVEEFRKFYKE
jgi:hypothetical protein